MRKWLKLLVICSLTLGTFGLATRADAEVTTPANGRATIGYPVCSLGSHRISVLGKIQMEDGYATQDVRVRMWAYSFTTKSWTVGTYKYATLKQGWGNSTAFELWIDTPNTGTNQYFVLIEYDWGRPNGSWGYEFEPGSTYLQEIVPVPGFYFQYGQCYA